MLVATLPFYFYFSLRVHASELVQLQRRIENVKTILFLFLCLFLVIVVIVVAHVSSYTKQI